MTQSEQSSTLTLYHWLLTLLLCVCNVLAAVRVKTLEQYRINQSGSISKLTQELSEIKQRMELQHLTDEEFLVLKMSLIDHMENPLDQSE